MKNPLVATRLGLISCAVALALPLAAHAQNITTVNGKAVPKARADVLVAQVKKQAASRGQQVPPNIDALARDKVVLDEIFTQEAEKRGIPASTEYKQQMEAARANILVSLLFADYEKTHPVPDAAVQTEYEKLKGENTGLEYHARHILVEKEDEAKAAITQIKGGAKFEDVAKKMSKDPGSAPNGGDLDFAKPNTYVPEFSEALMKLKKGEMTDTPVKSQFGYHVIKLEETREAKFPSLEEVKPQIVQRLEQQRVVAFREEVKKKAKTDYTFTQQ